MFRALRYEHLERRNLLSIADWRAVCWHPDTGYTGLAPWGELYFSRLSLWEHAPGFARGRA